MTGKKAPKAKLLEGLIMDAAAAIGLSGGAAELRRMHDANPTHVALRRLFSTKLDAKKAVSTQQRKAAQALATFRNEYGAVPMSLKGSGPAASVPSSSPPAPALTGQKRAAPKKAATPKLKAATPKRPVQTVALASLDRKLAAAQPPSKPSADPSTVISALSAQLSSAAELRQPLSVETAPDGRTASRSSSVFTDSPRSTASEAKTAESHSPQTVPPPIHKPVSIATPSSAKVVAKMRATEQANRGLKGQAAHSTAARVPARPVKDSVPKTVVQPTQQPKILPKESGPVERPAEPKPTPVKAPLQAQNAAQSLARPVSLQPIPVQVPATKLTAKVASSATKLPAKRQAVTVHPMKYSKQPKLSLSTSFTGTMKNTNTSKGKKGQRRLMGASGKTKAALNSSKLNLSLPLTPSVLPVSLTSSAGTMPMPPMDLSCPRPPASTSPCRSAPQLPLTTPAAPPEEDMDASLPTLLDVVRYPLMDTEEAEDEHIDELSRQEVLGEVARLALALHRIRLPCSKWASLLLSQDPRVSELVASVRLSESLALPMPKTLRAYRAGLREFLVVALLSYHPLGYQAVTKDDTLTWTSSPSEEQETAAGVIFPGRAEWLRATFYMEVDEALNGVTRLSDPDRFSRISWVAVGAELPAHVSSCAAANGEKGPPCELGPQCGQEAGRILEHKSCRVNGCDVCGWIRDSARIHADICRVSPSSPVPMHICRVRITEVVLRC